MCKKRILLAVATSLAMAGPARAQNRVQARIENNAAIAACDAAAANPLSDDLPADVTGLRLWEIEPKVAVPACEAAAKLAPNDARIAYQLGRAYAAAKSFALALAEFTRADERGYPLAAYNLAWMYSDARGVARDFVRAREWSERAAARGHALSMVVVERAYDYGCGAAQDEAEARRWYEKARASSNALPRRSRSSI